MTIQASLLQTLLQTNMRQLLRPAATLILLSGCLGIIGTSCSLKLGDNSDSSSQPATETPATEATVPNPVASASPTSPVADATEVPQPDPYQLAINRASSAFTISQAARSQDDWRLVVSRWQQAIDFLARVPASSPNLSLAQTKLVEYRRNLTYAQQQANRSTAIANPDGLVVVAPRSQSAESSQPDNITPPASRPTTALPAPNADGGGVYQVPIVRRAGGTPVIQVTFNNNQQFEMIVDTGASGTVITSQMAAALNIVPVGQANVDTASARNVTFPLGYVDSIQVGGAIAEDVLVAVAGPSLGLGLLGQDFFSSYDVTVRQEVVEFRER